MSKIEKILQCNDCLEKLNELCQVLDYNDAEREVAAEVLLWLEMHKLKKKTLNVPPNPYKPDSYPDTTKPRDMWNPDPSVDDLYTVKC